MNCDAAMNSAMSGKQNGAVVVIDLDTVATATVCVTLPPLLRQWARSPDVYAVVLQRTRAAAVADASAMTIEQTGDLLKLIWLLDCFSKPLVSLLDAPLTPLDIGLTTLGTHRVGGEAYRLAIPAPSDLSSLPVAGITYALARLPSATGADLVETGRAITSPEAYAAGLLTHTIPAAAFPHIIAQLADGQPVDQVLDGLQRESDAPSDGSGLAHPTREALRTVSSDAALRLVDDARALDVRESLIATYRLAAALRSQADDPNLKINLSQQPKSGDLQLPLRADVETGRF